jgi:hypothetical protein
VILCSQAADIHDERRLLDVWQASLGAVERLQEATVVAFRKQTLLSLDDCLYALQETIPHLTRSSLHWCLQRHGISRLPEIAGDKPAKQPFKRYPIGYFHIDIAEVRTGSFHCAATTAGPAGAANGAGQSNPPGTWARVSR